MPDFMRIGGVTGFLRSAAIAAAAAIFLSGGRRACHAHVGERTLTGMAGLELPGFATLQRHYEIRDGQVHIPEAPDLGIE